jgi:hypothetical protein
MSFRTVWSDEEEKEACEELWAELQKCDSWDDLSKVKTHDIKYLNHLKQCAIRPIETDMKNNLNRNTKDGYERARFIDRMIAHLEQLAINRLNK